MLTDPQMQGLKKRKSGHNGKSFTGSGWPGQRGRPRHAWTRKTDVTPPLPGDEILYDSIPKADYFARLRAGHWSREWGIHVDTLKALTDTRYVTMDRDLPAVEAPGIWAAAKAVRLDTGLEVELIVFYH